METTLLGRTGISVSRLCAGSWQVSGWASSNDEGFKKTLSHAIACGINFIDTAEIYGDGHAERLVGQVIKSCRDKVVIATKFSHTNSRPKQIRKALEGSLKRLATDYVDLYQQHWPPKAPPLQETIDELVKLKKEGKIRAIGVSNWMEPEWGEIKDPSVIESLQPCYSLLWRVIEKEVLPLCLRHNIAVIPYSSLCQGFLTGRFRKISEIPDDWRQKNKYRAPAMFEKMLKVLTVMDSLAGKYDKPLSAIALRWLLDKPGITAPIVGASRPEQVDENLKALNWHLEKADWEALSAASAGVSDGIGPHESMWGFHPRK